MTIAVIDAGFHNADKITAMQNIRILGTKDFVNPQSDIFAESSHGMAVLSCIAMNRPGVMTGTAPEASFWLLRRTTGLRLWNMPIAWEWMYSILHWDITLSMINPRIISSAIWMGTMR